MLCLSDFVMVRKGFRHLGRGLCISGLKYNIKYIKCRQLTIFRENVLDLNHKSVW